METIGKVTSNSIKHSVEWVIPNFLTLSKEDGKYYNSHTFSSNGESRYLRIYPNGSKKNNSIGNICVFLMRETSGPEMSQDFSLSLKNSDGKKEMAYHYTFTFKQTSGGYGTYCFISRSELVRKKFELLPSDSLTVVCTLKYPESIRNASSAVSIITQFISNSSTHLLGSIIATIGVLGYYFADAIFWIIVFYGVIHVLMPTGWFASLLNCFFSGTSEDKKCFCCKENLDAEFISLHETCTQRFIKCPDCSDGVLLKNWLHSHECRKRRTKGEFNTSVSCTVPPKNKILHDFKQFFLNQENCDVVLRVEGREFSAHKAILMARSPVFACTFRNDMKEKETGIVDIEDCDPSSFSDFLCFLYCEETECLSKENVFSLFIAADKYDVTDLKIKCLEFMKGNLSVDTFCETITLALQHGETELIHVSTDFFAKNAEEILETAKWQTFTIENPIQSNELFIKYVKSVKHTNI